MRAPRLPWIALAVVGLLGAVFWTLLSTSEQPFHDYVAERRAAGKPTTFDELLGPMPPDAENAAPELQAAWKALLADYGPSTEWKTSVFDTGPGIDEASPAQLAAFADLVTRMRPGFDKLSAALAKPRFRLPLKFDTDGSRVLDQISLLQNMSRAFAMPASAEPDPARRLAACRDVFVLTQHAPTDTWIDWMVRSAMHAGGVNSLRRAVETGAVDPVAAQRACDEFLKEPLADSLRHSCAGEPVGVIEQYTRLLDGRGVPRTAGGSFLRRAKRSFEKLKRRLAGVSVPMFEMEPGMPLEVVEMCRAMDVIGAADASRLTGSDAMKAFALPQSAQTTEMTIILPKLLTTVVRTEAAQRLARVALAVAAHRAEHDAFPASLDEVRTTLGGEVPLDPYSDAAFLYATTPSGVRITSSGHQPNPDDPQFRDLLIWDLK